MPKKIKISTNRKNINGTVVYNYRKKENKLLKAIDKGVRSVCDYTRKNKDGARIWSF